jgi:hypothetical protein
MFPVMLIQVILTLLVVGILLWGLGQLPVIDATIKQFIRVAIIVVTAIWLLYVLFGAGSVVWRIR